MPPHLATDRVLDRRTSALQIIRHLPRRQSQLEPMAEAVERDHMTLLDDRSGELGASLHLLSHHEEGGFVTRAREDREHCRGSLGMRAVVERKRDTTGARKRPRDSQRAGGARHDGGEGVTEHVRDDPRIGPVDLDYWLPSPMLRIAHTREAKVDPDALWAAARTLTLLDAGMLGRLVRWRIPGTKPGLTFDGLFRAAPFTVLENDSRALVSGLVGRIWTLRRDYPQLADPDEFRHWSKPGTARVLFANWVLETASGGARLSSEARVEAIGVRGRMGLRAVRPLIAAFHHLIGSDGIEAAVRRAEGQRSNDGWRR